MRMPVTDAPGELPTVLHVSTTDNWGGSARSAYRIHTGLKKLGVRSRMLVSMKTTDDTDVDLIAGRTIRMLDRLSGAVLDRLSLQYLYYPSSFLASRRTWFREADVVQFYNTHGGYFSHTALPLLCRRRPVVWRLSDMWPLTGHCAYAYDCERWKTGCGACPLLSDPAPLRRDTTALLWRIKRSVYAHSSMTLVAPSRWIAGLVAESPLMNRFPVHVIPNGLDTEVFHPIPQEAARDVLNMPRNGRVLLFSAQFLADRRKGGKIVRETLDRLRASHVDDVTILVVGAGANTWQEDLPYPSRRLEHVASDELMAAAYAAADLFLFPTLAENLPNGVLESMACGTPVVTFDVGGCAEAVRHLETGYVARYADAADFAHGANLLLQDAALRERLGRNARQIAMSEYALMLQAERHLELYRTVLNDEVRRP